MAKLVRLFENFETEYVNKPDFEIGDVVVIDEIENDKYEQYHRDELLITDMATSPDEDDAFDITIGEALYTLEVKKSGVAVPFKLYGFELKKA